MFTGGDMDTNKLIFTSEELDALLEQVCAHERAKFVLPDAITDNSESPEFRAGWNECREVMAGMLRGKP